MVRKRRGELAETLRRRILRGVQIGALTPGDRLPGTRELSSELNADARVVAAAYRVLAGEGLVELRPRAGAFVSRSFQVTGRSSGLARDWVANVLAEGIARGVGIKDLPGALAATLPPGTIRAVAIAATLDQTLGLCRELQDDFAVSCDGVLAENVSAGVALPRVVARAQLIVTTQANVSRVRSIAERQQSELVSITLRPDLYAAEFALLRGEHAYVIVADVRFARIVRDYLVAVDGSERVDVLVASCVDLSAIPADAPVYVTQAAREEIGPTRLPDGLLPTARMLATDCAREILEAVLRIAAK
ncbi:MAG TPA: winged helix-turn-helix domain-containing protein [Gemmatimonadaceae bacterium]